MRAELESMRRSLAIGGSLTRSDVEALLDACERMWRQQEQIRAVLAELGPAWTDARAALNRLHAVLDR